MTETSKELAPDQPPQERTFFGYPRWFGTLFVVDMWERFSFFGLSAILYLYLIASPADGGLGMSPTSTAALVGTYMALVFMAALPGGWIADRVLGARKATLYGGILIAVGHILLSIPGSSMLYLALGCIVVGTGLVKPSMASMIGDMYKGRPSEREAAFSIFYVSIQISALFAPVITGFAAERVNWHLGFSIAAFGMLAGLLHYVIAMRRQKTDVGKVPTKPLLPGERRVIVRRTVLWAGLPFLLITVGTIIGALGAEQVLMGVGVLVLLAPTAYWISLMRRPGIAEHRPRLRAFLFMLLSSGVFWMLFAQGPALLTLFAQESTDRMVGGFLVPASWFQSANPLFLLILAPFFAMLWVKLGSRVKSPPKFVAGLATGGLAFLLMAWASLLSMSGPVSPLWLLVVYLLLVVGELTVGVVGLSLAAQVAPEGMTSQMLGLFWLFAAVGSTVGGQLTRLTEVIPEHYFFLGLSVIALLVAAGLSVASRPLARRLSA